MYYEHAIVKFNSGNGALLCNDCNVIIRTGFDHEDKEHKCRECAAQDEPTIDDNLPD